MYLINFSVGESVFFVIIVVSFIVIISLGSLLVRAFLGIIVMYLSYCILGNFFLFLLSLFGFRGVVNSASVVFSSFFFSLFMFGFIVCIFVFLVLTIKFFVVGFGYFLILEKLVTKI